MLFYCLVSFIFYDFHGHFKFSIQHCMSENIFHQNVDENLRKRNFCESTATLHKVNFLRSLKWAVKEDDQNHVGT